MTYITEQDNAPSMVIKKYHSCTSSLFCKSSILHITQLLQNSRFKKAWLDANYSYKRHEDFSLESSQQRGKLFVWGVKVRTLLIGTCGWCFEILFLPLPAMPFDYQTCFVSPSLKDAIYSNKSSSQPKRFSNVYTKAATHSVFPSPQNVTRISRGRVPFASLALANKEHRQTRISSVFVFSLKIHLWYILLHNDLNTYSHIWQSAVPSLENLMVTLASYIIRILWQ